MPVVAVDSITDRIRRSIAQRGMVGTAKMCAEGLRWYVVPSLRKAEARRREADEAFDQQYGVDTAGVFRSKEEDVVGQNWAYGGNYQGIDPALFLECLSGVKSDFSELTFIDFGSGKGRAILLASTFPFKRVIGVEYCRELNRVARENITRFPAAARRCDRVEAVEADAAEYPLPEEPLLLFLYHPFAEPVMSKVVENVEKSFQNNPRKIVVLYLFPYHVALWEKLPFMKRVQDSPAILESQVNESMPEPGEDAAGRDDRLSRSARL